MRTSQTPLLQILVPIGLVSEDMIKIRNATIDDRHKVIAQMVFAKKKNTDTRGPHLDSLKNMAAMVNSVF
jgi:hemerythrin